MLEENQDISPTLISILQVFECQVPLSKPRMNSSFEERSGNPKRRAQHLSFWVPLPVSASPDSKPEMFSPVSLIHMRTGDVTNETQILDQSPFSSIDWDSMLFSDGHGLCRAGRP